MPLPRQSPAWISGLGLSTSIGGNTQQSLASLRAGLLRYEPTNRWLCQPWDEENGDLEPAMIAPVEGLDPLLAGTERLLQLAFPAMAEAIESAALSRKDLEGASLHLALPETGRPSEADLESRFPAELLRRSGLPRPATLTISRAGHCGVAEAIRAALEAQAATGAPALVVASDSLIDPASLQWMDERSRLKCSRAPEGVIAGEAATALVLEPPRTAERRGRTPLATIEALGFAVEAATVSSERACIGTGLGAAIREAAARLGAVPTPPWVVSDMNGERYLALEWSYVLTRLHTLFGGLRHQWFLADCVGETGAAVGGLAVARAIGAFGIGRAPSARAWLPLSADGGARAALVVGAPDTEFVPGIE